jgi:NAD(P)-dependent dehydrogenase (short-subunit alcohol dehydrogenase family)
MQDLEGKTAVVTGAASGMGYAFSTAFAGVGMNVVMADVEEDTLKTAAAQVEAAGGSVLAVPTDVSDEAAMLHLCDATREAFGSVHLASLNAGVAGAGGPMEQISTNSWKWTLGVNLYGIVHGIQAFLPWMKAQNEGHVVITASVAGLTSYPNMGPYNATKHAAVTIAETLYAELAEQESAVGVSCLCPGIVATRIGESERNRPKELSDEEPSQPVIDEANIEAFRSMFDKAKPPAEVAELVLAAVLENRFWIETDGAFRDPIRARNRSIEDASQPPATGTILGAYV